MQFVLVVYLSNRPQVPEAMVYINNSLHLARNYARIFVRAHYLFRVANTPAGYMYLQAQPRSWTQGYREQQQLRSRKTVSFEEQIMSKDKYPSIFSPQIEAIVFIILQIVFATSSVLKIGAYSRIFPSFSWRILAHVTPGSEFSLSYAIGTDNARCSEQIMSADKYPSIFSRQMEAIVNVNPRDVGRTRSSNIPCGTLAYKP